MTLPDFANKPWLVVEDEDETRIIVDTHEFHASGGVVSTPICDRVSQDGPEYYDRAIAHHIVALHNEALRIEDSMEAKHG